MDAEKKPEASKAADKLWDLIKKKGNVDFSEILWRLRVHINKESGGNIRKEAESVKGDLKFNVAL